MVVNIHARFELPTMGTLGDTECDIRTHTHTHTDTSPNEYIAASGFRRCRKTHRFGPLQDHQHGINFYGPPPVTLLNGLYSHKVALRAILDKKLGVGHTLG